MNANAVARHYALLTPEERFQLILAAGARGDDAEQAQLIRAGGRITYSTSDHAPFARAFDELATLTFIELQEEAARYTDALTRATDAGDLFGATDPDEDDGTEAGGQGNCVEADQRKTSAAERLLDLALAAGFVLRTKAEGWKLFCERLNVPGFVLWRLYPGLDRLQRALALAEKAAFTAEGFLRWANAVRPAGKPGWIEVLPTVEGVAAATEAMFRQRVAWWRG